MEVIEEVTSVENIIPDDRSLINTSNVINDDRFVIVGLDFWIPIVPEEIKPEEDDCYTSREAIREIYYTYAHAIDFDVRKNTEKKEWFWYCEVEIPFVYQAMSF
ncbi:hypothetical protein LXL04_021181 [Taraxacum kok-saghyz]